MRGRRLVLLTCAASHRALVGSLLPGAGPARRVVYMRHRALSARATAGSDPELPVSSEWQPPPGFVDWEDEEDQPPALSAGPDELDGPSRSPPPYKRPQPSLAAALETPRGQCSGCGARFQFEDGAAPGFVPQAAFEKRLARTEHDGAAVAPKQKDSPLCQRCHGLRFQNRLPVDALRVGGEATHAELQPDYFVRLLRDIARKRCVVVAIVDLFDFHGSLVPDLAAIVGTESPLVLVGNKVDLLPDGIDDKRIERWVRAEARKAALPPLHSLHLVSCKTGAGMPKLLDRLKEMMSVRAHRFDARNTTTPAAAAAQRRPRLRPRPPCRACAPCYGGRARAADASRTPHAARRTPHAAR
jgi:hypothetical protein